MRADRLWAIARRDLAQELSGRRGWFLPAVLAGLLLPASAIPPLDGLLPTPAPESALTVTGDVPKAVLALPDVQQVDGPARLAFTRDGEVLQVTGFVPGPVREALDDGAPTVPLTWVERPLPLPGRTLLFALLSASTLTGAVSASIAGERSRKTLVALLSAAVTRHEVVLGKWLAWTGLGAGSSLVAALVALALGHVEPGPWLLPMVMVPAGTVALGLFLARRATDLVGGTTVSLRVLPAALCILGGLAWYLGMQTPALGALVPLGGALMAAGGTWPGLVPAVLGSLATLLFVAGALWLTARDLEEAPREVASGPGAVRTSLALGSVAALAWMAPILTPILWAAAGNPAIPEQLPPSRGVIAGALGLLAIVAVRTARDPEPREVLGLRPASRAAWGLALAVAVGLALVTPVTELWSLSGSPLGDMARLRLSAALNPGWAGLGALVLVAVADEVLFRGILARTAGPLAAVWVWTLVKAPLEPVQGLLTGAMLTGLVHVSGGSVGPAIAARIGWGVLAGIALPYGPELALLIGAGFVGALWATGRARPAVNP